MLPSHAKPDDRGLPHIATVLSHVHKVASHAGKSVRSMAQGGRRLAQEVEGDPLDLLDAGNSRAMVKRAAKQAPRKAIKDGDSDDDFMHNDDGMMVIRVSHHSRDSIKLYGKTRMHTIDSKTQADKDCVYM